MQSPSPAPQPPPQPPTPPQKASYTQHLIAGAVAGLICDTLVHPMDTIRCCLQANRSSTGSLSTLSLLRSQSFFSLYRGFGAVVLCTIPAHSLYFTTYQAMKNNLLNKEEGEEAEEGEGMVHFVSGGVAELGGAMIWGPMDVVKQRVQAGGGTSSREVFSSVLKTEGALGLYKGFSAALTLYLPFMGIYFMTYEKFKKISQKKFQKYQERKPGNQVNTNSGNGGVELPFFGYLGSAACAGGVAAAVTSPLDVVKTRLQLEKASLPGGYKGIKDCCLRILKEEGPKAFGKGLLARVLWITPGTAISMATYEVTLNLLTKKSNNQ